MSDVRVEIDGRAATAADLLEASSGFGHFTAMQVRGGRTRGLALHLRRLEEATRELFDAPLDAERVRWCVRHALGGDADASVRVYLHESEPEPAIVVTVKPPGGVASSVRLRSVGYQRPAAHLKHLAAGQGWYSRLARAGGFDDALLVDLDGVISETAIANIGFFDGDGVVWPDAPQLRGITMQLLERALPSRGVPCVRAVTRLADLPSFDGAFVSNARGVAPVAAIDDVDLAVPREVLAALTDAYDAVPWDPL
jgi:branched-subunit amino acid aminotransferase/4-amino-4-deoxychorismate lyase